MAISAVAIYSRSQQNRANAQIPIATLMPTEEVPSPIGFLPIIAEIPPAAVFSCDESKRIFLPIFMYHHIKPDDQVTSGGDRSLTISPAQFEGQIRGLKAAGYEFVYVSDIPKFLSGEKKMPVKAVALTFDDGYDNNYTYAYPILMNNQARGTMYLITNFMGSKEYHLKYMDHGEIKTIIKSPYIELGSHSVNHPNLAYQGPYDWATEIIVSKSRLQHFFSQSIDTFAYPLGAYNEEIKKVVKNSGYTAAVSIKPGAYHTCGTLFELYRVRPNSYTERNIAQEMENLRAANK